MRKLKLFWPKERTTTGKSIRCSKRTLDVLAELRRTLLLFFAANPDLQPEGWSGEITTDEVIRILCERFAQDYGIKLPEPTKEDIQ